MSPGVSSKPDSSMLGGRGLFLYAQETEFCYGI